MRGNHESEADALQQYTALAPSKSCNHKLWFYHFFKKCLFAIDAVNVATSDAFNVVFEAQYSRSVGSFCCANYVKPPTYGNQL